MVIGVYSDEQLMPRGQKKEKSKSNVWFFRVLDPSCS